MFEEQDLQIFGVKLNQFYLHLQPLEAVDRGSETHIQVAENLSYLI